MAHLRRGRCYQPHYLECPWADPFLAQANSGVVATHADLQSSPLHNLYSEMRSVGRAQFTYQDLIRPVKWYGSSRQYTGEERRSVEGAAWSAASIGRMTRKPVGSGIRIIDKFAFRSESDTGA